MRDQQPRWARYARAAVGSAGPSPPASRSEQLRGWLREHAQDAHRRLDAAHREQAATGVLHRPDLRLLPAVAGAWITSAVAISRPQDQLVGAALLLVGAVLLATAIVCRRRRVQTRRDEGQDARPSPFMRPWRFKRNGRQHRAARAVPGRSGTGVFDAAGTVQLRTDRGRQWDRQWNRGRAKGRGVLAASGASMVFAVACILTVLLAVLLRQQSSAASPVALAAGADMALTLEVDTVPRLLDSAHGLPRVMFHATVLQSTAGGQLLTGPMRIRVFAKPGWEALRLGDRAVTAGRISPAEPGDNVAGLLRPSTGPLQVTAARGGSRAAVTEIRSSWVAAVNGIWEPLSADTAGLLPGMVMGDRSGLDNSLDESMKTVGLTHLTAVSGANCTLILASLMLALRSARAPRTVAVAASIAGLAGFVMVVGPDPSVLRAAVMGGIGAMAILGGRPKRVGSLLAAAILVLLLTDPWLSTDYAFILSVLATLGLHLVGQRCVKWLSAVLPLWLAQAVAIPLAAQLFCSPVIVLLQARLTLYTIPANMLAAPVIALVTTVGTLGMAVAAVVPPVAALCAAASGVGAWWVAAVARAMSGLPAASLPWPDGVQGMILMALLNVAVLCGLAAVVERQRAGAAVARLLAHVPAGWRRRFGLGSVVAAGATVAAWWTAAVVRL